MPTDLGLSGSDSARCTAAADSEPLSTQPMNIALWCAAQGWPVRPLAPRRETPAANCGRCQGRVYSYRDCPCLGAGRWCHGLHAATTTPVGIRAWWGEQPGFGAGVACGPAGLIVIDVDAHQAPLPVRDRLLPGIAIPETVSLQGLRHGFHSLALLAALRGAKDPALDASTLRVATPSGGLHIWCTAQPGQIWRCSAGSSPSRALARQVDVRAHGGYIIAPGTVTGAGAYGPLDGARFPAPLPLWLAVELDRTGHRPAPPSQRTATPVARRGHAAIVAAGGGRRAANSTPATVLAAVTECAGVAEGTGLSEKLNRAAYAADDVAAAGHLTIDEAQSVLLAAALQARPGQERRVPQIISSGLRAGGRRPLDLGVRT